MNKKTSSLSKKILKINELLIQKYGIPYRPQNSPSPIDLLIATILSQNTNDRNSYKAFTNLKNNYNSWDEIAKLPVKKIESEIKIAGLGKQKSFTIKNLLNTLIKKNNEIPLSYITEKNDEEIIHALTDFPGIGLKTASCVLLFSLKRNVCPVDTHVHRTSNRIGIAESNTPDKTYVLINNNLPENIAHSFHTNLIRLGREICKPANPLCGNCPLNKICKFKNKNYSSTGRNIEKNFMLLDNV